MFIRKKLSMDEDFEIDFNAAIKAAREDIATWPEWMRIAAQQVTENIGKPGWEG